LAGIKAFATTVVGSFPHIEAEGLVNQLIQMLDVPDWPQLPQRNWRESMYVQYGAHLPGVVFDEQHQKITFDTTGDLSGPLEAFYERYLADDVDAFGLLCEDAVGFYAMLEALRCAPVREWVKGQVTGPISFGLTVTDQDLRASLYNEMLADAIVKNMAMNARWQVRQLKQVCPQIILFVDEPYMASFGSAFISLGREQVTGMLDEVFEAIHAERALAGVHCCANTDWSVLLATQVDILNLDAYGYIENLALYPHELRQFIDRGGYVAWGIVPNTEAIFGVTPQALVDRMKAGLTLISDKAHARGVNLPVSELAERSLLAPSCGLGPATVDVAERALEVLRTTGDLLQRG
jgi:methionine synthase II (cobalamin-independent)